MPIQPISVESYNNVRFTYTKASFNSIDEAEKFITGYTEYKNGHTYKYKGLEQRYGNVTTSIVAYGTLIDKYEDEDDKGFRSLIGNMRPGSLTKYRSEINSRLSSEFDET